MGSVSDLWTRPGPDGPRVRTARWGRGMRWQAEWRAPDGTKHRRSFATKDATTGYVQAQETDKRRGTYVAPNRSTVGDLWPAWRS